jgi:hypothetical protein
MDGDLAPDHILRERSIAMAKTYNIFISHSWSYGDEYERLKELLKAKSSTFSFHDHSVPKDDPIHGAPNSDALYQAIKRQMSSCHVVIIMAGKYATYSTWIKKEIRIAKNEFAAPKPILAVTPWGAQQISDVVRQNADRIAGWNTESIISAIREIAL